MKIIEIEKSNPYSEKIYDVLDWIFFYGGDYLPFIFLKKVYPNGHMVQLPRWVTKRYMSTIDKKTRKFMNDLNWE